MVAPTLLGCVLVLVQARGDTQIIPQNLPLAGWEPATFGGIIFKLFPRGFSVGILGELQTINDHLDQGGHLAIKSAPTWRHSRPESGLT